VATFPASVTVAAGRTSAQFTVTARTVTSTQTAVIPAYSFCEVVQPSGCVVSVSTQPEGCTTLSWLLSLRCAD
jgi:hypothetical protein